MYISSPFYDRRVLLAVAPAGPEDFRVRAERLLHHLQERLSQSGISVVLEHSDDRPCDLFLNLNAGQSGATLAYNWINWRQNRKLADLIAEELRAATDLALSEGRVSLTLGRGAGTPVLEVSLPTRAPWCPEAVAHSLFRGLARGWNYPLLQAEAEPASEEAEGQPNEPAPEEMDDEERIILPTAPITSRPLLLRPVPAPEAAATPPPPADPAPAPEPPNHTKAASPRAVPYVISQASFSTRLIKAARQARR